MPKSVARLEVFPENAILGRIQMPSPGLQKEPAQNCARDYSPIARGFGQSAQVLRRTGSYLIGVKLVKTLLLSWTGWAS